MYKNVMVPVDGSAFSREAVLQGLRIASQSGGTLRLVRVGSSPVLVGDPNAHAFESSGQKQVHATEASELYTIAAECRANTTVNITATLLHGPVTDALIGYARRHSVDLIVMRSHARRGLARVWFGSVADSLIRKSGIPVLVVRPPSVATALEMGFRFKRILVVLDGSELAERSLSPALELAGIDNASVTLLRVVTTSSHRGNGDLESTRGHASAREVNEAQQYLDAQPVARSHGPCLVTRRVIVADDIPGTILRAADGEEVDLIAIATRGRGWVLRTTGGSVSDEVMRSATVSVLVTHPDSGAAAIEWPAASMQSVAV